MGPEHLFLNAAEAPEPFAGFEGPSVRPESDLINVQAPVHWK